MIETGIGPSAAARPSFELPRIVRSVGSRLPAYPASAAFALVLSVAAPRVIGREALATLDGKRFRIIVRDAGAVVAFRIASPRILPLRSDASVDVTFSANAGDFQRLATRRADPDTLFFDRRLLIEGDTETGLTLKNILDAVEVPRWITGV
jgi:predicted lipid carrier protein YhbT